jgi:DNA repair protein RadC
MPRAKPRAEPNRATGPETGLPDEAPARPRAKESPAEYHLSLRDRPADERPRERMQNQGPLALSDAELLAIILRVGCRGNTAVDLGNRLLKEFDGLAGIGRAQLPALRKTPGVGLAKAAQVKAAMELGRRASLLSADAPESVRSPLEVANLVRRKVDPIMEQEELWALFLSGRNAVLGAKRIYQGSINCMQVRPAEVFREAIALNAVAVVVAHTHPSGDPTPSPEDVEVTKQLVQAGRALGVEVLDHLILGRQQLFVSLKERGLAFR